MIAKIANATAAPVAATGLSRGRYAPVIETRFDDYVAVACFSAAEARHYRALGWPELVIPRSGRGHVPAYAGTHRANSFRWITLAEGVRVFVRPT